MTIGVGLEIVIALAALFWLLAMVASYVVEAFNSLLFNVRAKALERFVCEMVLGDGKVRQQFKAMKGKLSQSLAADPLGLLSHGMITSLRKPKALAGGEGSAPSYIPAQVFAKVLLDRLAMLAAAALPTQQVVDVVGQLVGPQSPLPQPVKDRISFAMNQAKAGGEMFAVSRSLVEGWHSFDAAQAIQEIQVVETAAAALPGLDQVKTFLEALLSGARTAIEQLLRNMPASDANRPLCQLIGDDPAALWMAAMRMAAQQPGLNSNLVDAVRQVVDHAPLPTSLRDALRPIVAQANFDLDAIRTGVETWYDEVMQRASGWFKRNTTWWLAACGFVLAILFNFNPLLIFGELARDPALRTAGVGVAEGAVARGGDPELVQQLIFSNAADRLRWQARLDDAVKDGNGEGLPRLAFEMGPLLLRSGHYVGFLPQMLAVSRPEKWTDDETNKLRKNLCSAYLEAKPPVGRPAGSAIDNDLKTDCAELLKGIETTPTAEAQPTAAVAEPASSSAAWPLSKAFWSKSQLYWNAELSKALYDALVAIKLSTPKDQRATALSHLKESYQNASREAKSASQSAQNFLSRIPSMGGTPFRRWPGPEWGAIGLDIIGWLLTAIMVSFGAPFWFDLMSKLVDSHRATGPKPAADADMKVCNRGGHVAARFAAVIVLLLTCGVAATKAAEPLAPASPRTPTQDVPECTPPQSCCPSAVVPDVVGNQSRRLSYEDVRRVLSAKGLNEINRVSRPRPDTAHERVYAVLPGPGERVCLDTRIVVYVAVPGIPTPGTATPGTATPGTATPGTATPGTATPGTATPGTATTEPSSPAQATAGLAITSASVGAAGLWLVARVLASRVSQPTSPAQPQMPGAPTGTVAASKRLRLRVRTDIG